MTIHLKGYCIHEYHVDPLSDFTWISLYTHKKACDGIQVQVVAQWD